MQKVDLEMADYDKRTALHLAASEGHFDVALFLLEIGKVKPDPKDRSKILFVQFVRNLTIIDGIEPH